MRKKSGMINLVVTSAKKMSMFLKKKQGKVYSCSTNIAILGASRVGKTTIARSFAMHNHDGVSYRSTLCELYKRSLSLKSKDGTLCNHSIYLLDTSGELRADFPDTYRKTVESCEAFVLVFSLDDIESLIALKDILKDIDVIKKTFVTPILVVANKKDLEIQNSPSYMNRQIAAINRGCCFKKMDTEEYLDCFVNLLTIIEKRKGIERTHYGVYFA